MEPNPCYQPWDCIADKHQTDSNSVYSYILSIDPLRRGTREECNKWCNIFGQPKPVRRPLLRKEVFRHYLKCQKQFYGAQTYEDAIEIWQSRTRSRGSWLLSTIERTRGILQARQCRTKAENTWAPTVFIPRCPGSCGCYNS